VKDGPSNIKINFKKNEDSCSDEPVEVTQAEVRKMQRARKLRELQKAIDNGDYNVSSEDIAHSIIIENATQES